MNDKKGLLITAAEIVTFLFAAFNGVLLKIAPPTSRVGGLDANYVVGVTSFATLLIFVLIRAAVSRRLTRRLRRRWLIAASALSVAFIGAAGFYRQTFTDHTFVYKPTEAAHSIEIAGDEYTLRGKRMADNFQRDRERPPLPQELIAFSEGNDPARIPGLWTRKSIVNVQNKLVYLYVAMVIFLASAIASALELLRPNPSQTAA